MAARSKPDAWPRFRVLQGLILWQMQQAQREQMISYSASFDIESVRTGTLWFIFLRIGRHEKMEWREDTTTVTRTA